MNITRYYPFERNRYFYGKLLTVRDFESEQKYFTHKLRLLNRLLHGTGVVSGLHVVAVDDKSISVEAGLALDHLGREIVVPTPTTLKLSTIEGFSNNEYAKSVYLCLAYHENGKEPVHSVANSSTRSEEVSEYNRILESYRLFIQEEPPQPAVFENASLLEDTSVVYQDEHVRILHSTPRYVQPNQVFEAMIKIEKSLQAPKVRLELELAGDHFELIQESSSALESGKRNMITYTEPQKDQITDEVIRYVLRAKHEGSSLHEVKLQFKTDSSFIVKGEQKIALETDTYNTITVTQHDPKAQLLRDYFSRTLDQSVQATAESCIYLAKIHLLQMGSTYMIEKVDEVPFNEYVHNPSFLQQLGEATARSMQGTIGQRQKLEQDKLSGVRSFAVRSELKELKAKEKPHFQVNFQADAQQFEFSLALPHMQHTSDEVSTGVVEIKLGQGGGFFKSKAFISDEVEHGLGTDGSILIMTALEESNNGVAKHQTQQIYFGDADVFKDSEYEAELANLSIGSVLHKEKGTFQIGVRVQGTVSVPRVRIRWWAIKKTVINTVDRSSKPYPQSEIAATTDQNAKS